MRPFISSIMRVEFTFVMVKDESLTSSFTCFCSLVRCLRISASSGESGMISWLVLNCWICLMFSSSRMSSADWTSLAPFLMRSFVPFDIGLVRFPGMAKTSRLCSRANLAVIRAPELSPASITRVPRLRPEMIRFLIGKLCLRGSVPIGYSEMRRPFCSTIF